MRKSIFKREMESCFQDSAIPEGKRLEILKVIFENPLNDGTKQYLLKKEINNVENISNLVGQIEANHKFVSDVRSLFEVDDDLELPDTLREQLRRKERIALFVGAGVSKLIGIPLWVELADKAIDYLREQDLITFSEAEKIKAENVSPKQKMSIFHNILPKENSKTFYDKYLKPQKELLDRNPYKILIKLDVPKFTSNLDHEFWNALEQRASIQPEQSESQTQTQKPVQAIYGFKKNLEIRTDVIYQVHGSYQQIDRFSIVTMKDYLKHYFQDEDLREFLKKIFNEYIVIFIGYSMEEFEILQHLVKTGRGHHVLIGTYLADTNLLRMKKEYFRTLEINAHGYYMDFNGYNRLYEVIDYWVKKINSELTGGFYQKTGEFRDVEL